MNYACNNIHVVSNMILTVCHIRITEYYVEGGNFEERNHYNMDRIKHL